MAVVKKSLAVAGYLFILLVGTLIAAELGLRVYLDYTQNPYQQYAQQYTRLEIAHLHSIWTGAPPENPLLPPLTVYSDRDSSNAQRLTEIYNAVRFPASSTWQGYDFIDIQTNATATAYTVHINSLGFRGGDYAAQKPPHTYRIIVLGSYQAFGLGVADGDTYVARLESLLNARHDGTTYEVWNLGRPAGTAIVGLAQMEHDIFNFQPDLIILDYGQVDSKVFGDNFFPRVLLFPGPFGSLMQRFAGPVYALLDRSVLWSRWLNRQTSDTQLSENFSSLLKQMADLSWQHHVPTVLVQELPADAITADDYRALVNEHTFFFNVENWFQTHPPQYPPPSEWKSGYWASTYLAELDPAQVSIYTRPFEYYPYRLDLFQLNKYGMDQVARGLLALIDGIQSK